MNSPVQSVIEEFTTKYGELAPKLIETLLGYINDGWNLTKAVNQALVDVGLNDFLTENIETAIREGAAIGAGVKTIPLLKPLESEWDGSGMKLSAKLHGTQKQMRQNIISTVQAQIALNKHAHETAMKLYDGYNTSDNVIRKQELPKYINDLAVFARRSDLPGLSKLCRQTRRKVDRLAKNGAPTKALKVAYSQLIDAVEKHSEKALENAVKVAVEEKTRYTAERIARTESARAWLDGYLKKYGDNERVVAHKWKLSSRHPVFDICDMYAKADMYGLGKGVFPKDKIPNLPVHPHCLCYLSPVYKSELKGKQQKENIKEAGDKWLKTLPKQEQYKVLGLNGLKAWQNGADWRNYVRNYSTDYAKTRLKDVSLSNDDMNYMAGRFKPKYGKEADVNIPGTKTFIPIKKVTNSNFNLWAEKSENQRSMPVKICEKILNQIQADLPEILEIPQIIIVDFDKYNINSSAIGGHDPKTGNIFINAKYRIEKSITDYLAKNEGFFASTDITAPYLHELGHRYYDLVIEKIAEKQQISYNKARNLIEEPIREYVKQHSKFDYEFVEKQISRYAYNNFDSNKFSEVIAELFSVKDIKKDNDFIKYIFKILSKGM